MLNVTFRAFEDQIDSLEKEVKFDAKKKSLVIMLFGANDLVCTSPCRNVVS